MKIKKLTTLTVHLSEDELDEIIFHHVCNLPQFSSFDASKLKINWEVDSGVEVFVEEKVVL